MLFVCEQADVRTNAVLRERLPAGRWAATGSRIGGETHLGTPVPETIAITVVVVHGLVHPATDRGQTGRQCQQVTACPAVVGEFAQEESAAVVGVQQPKVNDDHRPRTDGVHASCADCQGKIRLSRIESDSPSRRVVQIGHSDWTLMVFSDLVQILN